jgi:hypothetical protein
MMNNQAHFEDSVNWQPRFLPVFLVCSLLPSWVTLRTVGNLKARSVPRQLESGIAKTRGSLTTLRLTRSKDSPVFFDNRISLVFLTI